MSACSLGLTGSAIATTTKSHSTSIKDRDGGEFDSANMASDGTNVLPIAVVSDRDVDALHQDGDNRGGTQIGISSDGEASEWDYGNGAVGKASFQESGSKAELLGEGEGHSRQAHQRFSYLRGLRVGHSNLERYHYWGRQTPKKFPLKMIVVVSRFFSPFIVSLFTVLR
ncbi:hypothetical protein NE237_031715 [Protea cynaroides]|uniref:Uncharacterized protein n=1 Tax=Protea cynaroides TaxID=273540 RepID=A0A9Q0R2F3_9MAGN|nr:hypothetical protein NE237_031715 [Protea cynaroides]